MRTKIKRNGKPRCNPLNAQEQRAKEIALAARKAKGELRRMRLIIRCLEGKADRCDRNTAWIDVDSRIFQLTQELEKLGVVGQ